MARIPLPPYTRTESWFWKCARGGRFEYTENMNKGEKETARWTPQSPSITEWDAGSTVPTRAPGDSLWDTRLRVWLSPTPPWGCPL